jgi:hypothetical protein
MAEQTPYDESGNVAIPNVPGWQYLPFHDDGDHITIVPERDADGCRLVLSLPSIVQRGVELARSQSL